MVKQTDPFDDPPFDQSSSPFEGFLFVLALVGTALGLALICEVLS